MTNSAGCTVLAHAAFQGVLVVRLVNSGMRTVSAREEDIVGWIGG